MSNQGGSRCFTCHSSVERGRSQEVSGRSSEWSVVGLTGLRSAKQARHRLDQNTVARATPRILAFRWLGHFHSLRPGLILSSCRSIEFLQRIAMTQPMRNEGKPASSENQRTQPVAPSNDETLASPTGGSSATPSGRSNPATEGAIPMPPTTPATSPAGGAPKVPAAADETLSPSGQATMEAPRDAVHVTGYKVLGELGAAAWASFTRPATSSSTGWSRSK